MSPIAAIRAKCELRGRLSGYKKWHKPYQILSNQGRGRYINDGEAMASRMMMGPNNHSWSKGRPEGDSGETINVTITIVWLTRVGKDTYTRTKQRCNWITTPNARLPFSYRFGQGSDEPFCILNHNDKYMHLKFEYESCGFYLKCRYNAIFFTTIICYLRHT